MFVADGIAEPRPISSMPGVVQHTRDSLRQAAAEAVDAGVGGLMLFGVPRDEDKDAVGSCGLDPDGILNVALRDLAKDLGDATVLTSSPTTGTAVCWMPAAWSTTTPRTPST
jgi:porphobilinogen synthase